MGADGPVEWVDRVDEGRVEGSCEAQHLLGDKVREFVVMSSQFVQG